MPELSTVLPITVYGSSISYFTGKLENYFRIKGIPYTLQPLDIQRDAPVIRDQVGSTQMPAIKLGDGRFMSDSTVIIQWFEDQFPEPALAPEDPVQQFFCLLLEDYADEWLWRPAMHYRWYYEKGARFAAYHLIEEIAPGVRLPGALMRWRVTRRQRQGYTTGDGIAEDQVAGVEAIYLRTLSHLEAIFQVRPFLLGDRPTVADIGFSGPFFRHFGLDPVPAEILRRKAPSVNEWIARLWNTRLRDGRDQLASGIPDDWTPILEEIGHSYLPYLCHNVHAIAAGEKRFDADIGGVRYRGARSSKYRVWCLHRLREHYQALDEEGREQARTLLENSNCWEPLWRETELPMAPGLCGQLPFHVDAKMIDVYD